MKILSGLKLHLCVLVAVIATTSSLAIASGFDNVLIVSIDALVPEAIEDSPFISGLMREGFYSLDARSVDPPLTLISHSAMMTGKSPKQGGRKDNDWTPDEPTVNGNILFHTAKRTGYRTGFFYAKEKLGYLLNPDVDEHILSTFPTDEALQFVRQGNSFTFVHISGLDQIGPQFGWLSKEYREELGYIDEYLKPLVESVRSQGEYCIIILSDHGGHEKLHGCGHLEDFKIPIVVVQSHPAINPIDLSGFTTNDLPTLVAKALER